MDLKKIRETAAAGGAKKYHEKNAETGKLFATPALREKLAALGMDPATGRPGDLSAAIQADTQRWAEVIRQKNIKPD